MVLLVELLGFIDCSLDLGIRSCLSSELKNLSELTRTERGNILRDAYHAIAGWQIREG